MSRSPPGRSRQSLSPADAASVHALIGLVMLASAINRVTVAQRGCIVTLTGVSFSRCSPLSTAPFAAASLLVACGLGAAQSRKPAHVDLVDIGPQPMAGLPDHPFSQACATWAASTGGQVWSTTVLPITTSSAERTWQPNSFVDRVRAQFRDTILLRFGCLRLSSPARDRRQGH